MKGKFDLEAKFDKVSAENCFISEMTLAELKWSVAAPRSGYFLASGQFKLLCNNPQN